MMLGTSDTACIWRNGCCGPDPANKEGKTNRKTNIKMRSGRDTQGVLNGIDCDVSLAFVLRGVLNKIQHTATEIEQILKENDVRAVYRVLYPGRLWIQREPVTEQTNKNEGGMDGGP